MEQQKSAFLFSPPFKHTKRHSSQLFIAFKGHFSINNNTPPSLSCKNDLEMTVEKQIHESVGR